MFGSITGGHCALFSIHCSLFTVQRIINNTLFTRLCLVFTICYARYSRFTTIHYWFVIILDVHSLFAHYSVTICVIAARCLLSIHLVFVHYSAHLPLIIRSLFCGPGLSSLTDSMPKVSSNQYLLTAHCLLTYSGLTAAHNCFTIHLLSSRYISLSAHYSLTVAAH